MTPEREAEIRREVDDYMGDCPDKDCMCCAARELLAELDALRGKVWKFQSGLKFHRSECLRIARLHDDDPEGWNIHMRKAESLAIVLDDAREIGLFEVSDD